MSKQNDPLKNDGYLSQCLTEFLDKLVGMNIAKSKAKNIEKELWKHLRKIRESVYRAVEHDYLTEDLMDKIKEYYGNKGLLVANCVPRHILDGIIDDWQEDIGDADLFWDINWKILEDRLADESWLSGLRPFTHREISIYRCYLTDWYKDHQEGDPVCIREFFNCKMKDADTRSYYLSLADKRSRSRGKLVPKIT